MTDPSPKEKTRSQCSVIVVKKYRVICLFLASFFSDFFAKEVFKEATMLQHHDDVLSMEISSAKRKRERERLLCVYNDGSQSVKRRRTLSTRCLVQFTNAGRAVVDLPHHPFFYGGRI